MKNTPNTYFENEGIREIDVTVYDDYPVYLIESKDGGQPFIQHAPFGDKGSNGKAPSNFDVQDPYLKTSDPKDKFGTNKADSQFTVVDPSREKNEVLQTQVGDPKTNSFYRSDTF